MNGYIIDRREQHRDKSPTSRERSNRRHRDIIKQTAADTIRLPKTFTDLTDRPEHSISIDRKSLDDPHFVDGAGGEYEFVLSGNDQFGIRDTMTSSAFATHCKDRAAVRGVAATGAQRLSPRSPDGEAKDDFTFNLDCDEFLRLIREHLELPDLVKRNLTYSVIEEPIITRAPARPAIST